jgi:hypothetical protein
MWFIFVGTTNPNAGSVRTGPCLGMWQSGSSPDFLLMRVFDTALGLFGTYARVAALLSVAESESS